MKHGRLMRSVAVLSKYCLLCIIVASASAAPPVQPPALEQSRSANSAPEGTLAPPVGLGAVVKRGTGPIDMILIPSHGFDWRVYESFMARHLDVYTMYAVTLPGFGSTEPLPEPDDKDYSKTPWCNAVEKGIVVLIAAQQMDRPIVVGHHVLGDHMAIRLSIHHPELFRAAVIIGGRPVAPIRSPADQNRAATPKERVKFINGVQAAALEQMTQAQWAESLERSSKFICRDQKRASELLAFQAAAPVKTLMRYFLEYAIVDLTESLSTVPMEFVAIQPVYDIESGISEAARIAMARQNDWALFEPMPKKMRVTEVYNSRLFVTEDQPFALDKIFRDLMSRLRREGEPSEP